MVDIEYRTSGLDQVPSYTVLEIRSVTVMEEEKLRNTVSWNYEGLTNIPTRVVEIKIGRSCHVYTSNTVESLLCCDPLIYLNETIRET